MNKHELGKGVGKEALSAEGRAGQAGAHIASGFVNPMSTGGGFLLMTEAALCSL